MKAARWSVRSRVTLRGAGPCKKTAITHRIGWSRGFFLLCKRATSVQATCALKSGCRFSWRGSFLHLLESCIKSLRILLGQNLGCAVQDSVVRNWCSRRRGCFRYVFSFVMSSPSLWLWGQFSLNFHYFGKLKSQTTLTWKSTLIKIDMCGYDFLANCFLKELCLFCNSCRPIWTAYY